MQAIKKQKYTEVQLESYKRGDKMSNNIPVLMLRGSDGKFFPVAGITGGGGAATQIANKLMNSKYNTATGSFEPKKPAEAKGC